MSFVNTMGSDRWTKAEITARVSLLATTAGYTLEDAQAEGVAAEADAAKLHAVLDLEAARRKVEALSLALITEAKMPKLAAVKLPKGMAIPFAAATAATLEDQLNAATAELETLLASTSQEIKDLLEARKPVTVKREVELPEIHTS